MTNTLILKFRVGAPLLFAVILLASSSGCAHKKVNASEGNDANAAIQSSDLGTSDMGNAMGLQTVHYEYDTALLSASGKATLDKDAEILKDNPNIMVQIEGSCDARGGIQYNLALGQKRADAARDYLVDRGIAASRLSTLSYGKEKPVANGDTEAAYAKNRRANLAITKK